jgi:hypothetical protein
MFIKSSTADELVLMGSGTVGVILGTIFIIVGIGVGFASSSATPWAKWVAVVLAVIGFVSIVLALTIIDINKASGQITYQTRIFIWKWITAYPVADILRIERLKEWKWISSSLRRGSIPHRALVVHSFLIFRDGRRLKVDGTYEEGASMSGNSAVSTGNKSVAADIATQAATLLGLPVHDSGVEEAF